MTQNIVTFSGNFLQMRNKTCQKERCTEIKADGDSDFEYRLETVREEQWDTGDSDSEESRNTGIPVPHRHNHKCHLHGYSNAQGDSVIEDSMLISVFIYFLVI